MENILNNTVIGQTTSGKTIYADSNLCLDFNHIECLEANNYLAAKINSFQVDEKCKQFLAEQKQKHLLNYENLIKNISDFKGVRDGHGRGYVNVLMVTYKGKNI